ncbi:MAG TPA: MFS transporter [Thiotrichaceae bacterium]|nr:MFS transporter [Thiotrichaceae bacterium]
MKTLPYYWRLSAFYFFYYASLGAFLPYWALYLHTLGFNAQAIGELIAILLAMKIIAPNISGWIADHTGRPIALVRLCALLAALFFITILFGQSYLWLAIVLGVFSVFWHATLPPFEAYTLARLGKQSHRYSQIRLWGSIGFILTVILLGWLFESFSVTLLPILLIVLFAGIWLSSLLVPEKKTAHQFVSSESFYQVIKRPSAIALFLVCFLMQASHGPYYTFYSIYLEDYGYSRNLIGQLWALGVVAEVGIFLVMHHLLTRFGLKQLLIISFGLSGLRWLLIGYYVESLPILLFAQLFHAASFGMYHGIAIQLIRQHFADHHQGRAQALYSSISFGAGGAVGSLVSGYTWENLGAQFNYLWATLICVIAIWITWRWVGE